MNRILSGSIYMLLICLFLSISLWIIYEYLGFERIVSVWVATGLAILSGLIAGILIKKLIHRNNID